MSNEAKVSATLVKSLRESTGVGMMECKKALVECSGDLEQARDLLRVRSGVKADKVASRQALEGRIAFAENENTGVLVEITCETDFVARDENLVNFATQIAQSLAQSKTKPDDIASLKIDAHSSVEEMRQGLVMKCGENISIGQIVFLQANTSENGYISHYIHLGGKIAAICSINSNDKNLGRDICMHIAAMRPLYLDESAVPASVLEQEKKIFTAQSIEMGKSVEMAEKIANGKMKKRLSEITLINQTFVKDSEKTISDLLNASQSKIEAFQLIVVGENNCVEA